MGSRLSKLKAALTKEYNYDTPNVILATIYILPRPFRKAIHQHVELSTEAVTSLESLLAFIRTRCSMDSLPGYELSGSNIQVNFADGIGFGTFTIGKAGDDIKFGMQMERAWMTDAQVVVYVEARLKKDS